MENVNNIDELLREDEESLQDYQDTMILLEEEEEILPFHTANEYLEEKYFEGQMI